MERLYSWKYRFFACRYVSDGLEEVPGERYNWKS